MELNPQLIDDSIGSFKKVFNEDVLATFTTLAQTMKKLKHGARSTKCR